MIKKTKNGILFGVCGGIGESLGIGAMGGQIIGIILMFSTTWFWGLYLLLAVIMDKED